MLYKKLSLITLIRVSSLFISLILGVVLSRGFGSEGFGFFTFIQAVFFGLSLLIRRGRERAVLKFYSCELDPVKSKAFLINQILSFFNVKVILLSFLSMLLVGIYSANKGVDPLYVGTVFLSILFHSIFLVVVYYFRAIGHVFLSVFFENIVINLLLLIGSLILIFFKMEINFLFLVYFFCIFISFLFVLLLFYKIPSKITGSNFIDASYFDEVSRNFFIVGLLGYFQKTFIFVISGFILEFSDVALLKVSERISLSVSLILMVINSIYPQKFSLLSSKDDIRILFLSFRTATLLSISLSSLAALFCLFFSEFLLGIFSEEYLGKSVILYTIVFGVLFSGLCGPVGSFLNMTGYHVEAKNSSLINCVFLLFSFPVLTYFFGVLGAACSISISQVLLNLYLWFIVNKKFGLSFIGLIGGRF